MTKRPRKKETKGDIIATLILQFCKTGDGRPIITRDQAKTMTPEQAIRHWRSTVVRQHGGAHATDGADHFSNYWFTPREIDAVETPRDISRIAKGKRLAKAHATHVATVARKAGLTPETVPLPVKKGIRRQPMAGSRASPWKRTMRNGWERRP